MGVKSFKVYLFDFDGTLVDTYESLYRVFAVSYEAVGVTINRGDVANLMRCPLYVGYQKHHGPEDEESKKLFGDKIIELLDDPEVLKLSKTYDEVKEVLFELKKQNKTLGIVTSNNSKHVRDVLKYINLDEKLFSVIVGNQESPRHKPFPDPVLTAVEKLGVNKEKVCYVGDGLDDIRCAKAAGVTPILVDRYNEYEKRDIELITNLKPLID